MVALAAWLVRHALAGQGAVTLTRAGGRIMVEATPVAAAFAASPA